MTLRVSDCDVYVNKDYLFYIIFQTVALDRQQQLLTVTRGRDKTMTVDMKYEEKTILLVRCFWKKGPRIIANYLQN